METLSRMLKHLHWANLRLLDTLQQEGIDEGQALRLFSHILNAERVWITRLRGEDSSYLPIWSDRASLAECSMMVDQNEEDYRCFFESMNSPVDIVSYKNSLGESFRSSIRDILTHVALHGQYHRGQINALLRQSGVEPVSIDYVIYARE